MKMSAAAKEESAICTCNCGNCIDGRIIKTVFYAVELLLSRVENGLKLPDEMMILIQALAHYCEKCNKELDK
jgi:hypothetical protein